MSKFKKGARVWVNCDYPENKPRVFKGQQAMVLRYEAEYDDPTNTLVEVLFDDGQQDWMFEYRFELVSGNEPAQQESKMKFDMKVNPWIIYVNSKEQFEVVRDWVKSRGITFEYSEDYEKGMVAVGSALNLSHLCHRIHDGDRTEGFKEIKLNFKTVVDSVEWPEVETEAQKELAKLQKQIEELSAQAEKLKETIK